MAWRDQLRPTPRPTVPLSAPRPLYAVNSGTYSAQQTQITKEDSTHSRPTASTLSSAALCSHRRTPYSRGAKDLGHGQCTSAPCHACAKGEAAFARPWREESVRSTVDHVVQAFDGCRHLSGFRESG